MLQNDSYHYFGCQNLQSQIAKMYQSTHDVQHRHQQQIILDWSIMAARKGKAQVRMQKANNTGGLTS
jgi:hypothetical protein